MICVNPDGQMTDMRFEIELQIAVPVVKIDQAGHRVETAVCSVQVEAGQGK